MRGGIAKYIIYIVRNYLMMRYDVVVRTLWNEILRKHNLDDNEIVSHYMVEVIAAYNKIRGYWLNVPSMTQ